MTKAVVSRLRKICLALPEAAEALTWEHVNFRVRAKIFAMVTENDERPVVVFKAPPGSQAILVGADPDRFYRPPYVGPKGWVGMWLDAKPDWKEVEALVRRSYRMTAPKKLSASIEE